MNRTRAAMLLLCAACVAPSFCFAVIQEAVPDVHRQSLVEMEPGALTLADDSAPPLRLLLARPLELPPDSPDSPGRHGSPPFDPARDESIIAALFTDEDLFADGTWIDKRVLQALSPRDCVVKVRKWWAQRPYKKKQPAAVKAPAKPARKR